MAAYLIVQSAIGNEQQYQTYREAVVPLIQTFGGEFAVKGAQVEGAATVDIWDEPGV